MYNDLSLRYNLVGVFFCLFFVGFFYWDIKQRVCCLLNDPAVCQCISGMDLLRQLYMLPH